MYYTHKKYSLDKHKVSEINSLFAKYDLADLHRISPKDARELLRTIGIPQNAIHDIVAKSDPEHRGSVRYTPFLENIRHYLGEEHILQEMRSLFQLVYQISTPLDAYHPEVSKLTIEKIRKTASILGEPLTDNNLKDMMEYADPENTGMIDIHAFVRTMRKTSIW
ncbi:hypothetical protein BC833DRAFT_423103 [Globomyces pollinis-pini]|nr:hypothetical protein BC833DRAFT_423103 [Globomyces pollinis-pini]